MDDIVFIGDWVKDRVLGSGSFGTVVLWKHKRTDERLALKTCKWGDELTAKHRERWTKEVEMMQTCSNANIVSTKDLPPEFLSGLKPANPSGLPILCMEYCSGGDLRQLLNKPELCSGLKEMQIRHILSDICNALKFLHLNKITHRDLKPENIVLHINDSTDNVGVGQPQRKVTYKLIDLGYAKEIDSNSVCASFVGTLQYLAPEIMYSKTYSNSVDYWSFGLLAFEIICGVRPFLPHMAPVQWMPYVKKKKHENICVYEPFHEGDDVIYFNEVFPENHVSRAFKGLIEKWLQVALEYDPKMRGRDTPSKVTFNIPTEQQGNSSKVVIFNLLETILSTKIIKIFSIPTLSQVSYEIDDTITIETLKTWLSRDTMIPTEKQILISQTTYIDIPNDQLVSAYWNENSNYMIYLYSKTHLINENTEPVVPKAVQRCLAQPKQLYNFKNGQTLYRHALYFVMSQMDIYEGLINGLFTRAESMKYESKQLLLKHNNVDKTIGKLVTQEETIMKLVEVGKKHIDDMKDSGTATNYLGGFHKIFGDADILSDKINKLHAAWNQLSVRLQSAARRSNEVLTVDLNTFVGKHNFQALFINAVKTYVNYKRSEFHSEHKTKDKQCTDIIKICYDTLKYRSKIITEMQNQTFILKLNDLSVELSKISDIVANALNNIEKLDKEMNDVTDELSKCMWSTLSLLASNADNVADLPYSVVSFQKLDFKPGEAVSNPKQVAKNHVEDEMVKSLIAESLHIRQNQMNLSKKLNAQKSVIKSYELDFSFLNDKVDK